MEEQGIRLFDNRIDIVVKRITEKMDIPIEKAQAEIKMGILLGMIMNRHRSQEIMSKVE